MHNVYVYVYHCIFWVHDSYIKAAQQVGSTCLSNMQVPSDRGTDLI